MMAAGVLIAPFVSAQSNFSVLYQVGIPMGALSEHTSQVSGRGMALEYQKYIKSNISVGLNFGYSVFYEKMPYGSYTSGTATLTGTQYRYNNLFPMSVVGQYHLNTSGSLRPYFGLGIGTIYDIRNTDMGLWTVEQNNWHFLLSPEAGISYKLSGQTALKLNAKYDNAFKIEKAGAFANLNFNIGFVFSGGMGGF